MISSIELEGFQGVNDRIRIELAPLTFLFGHNRAGKSTILRALLYMLDLLQSGRADVHRAELAGAPVDLGGFGRLVHRHDLSRTLAIRVELETPRSLNCFERRLRGLLFTHLDREVSSAWIEVRVRWFGTPRGGAPFVSELLVGTPSAPAPIARLWIDRAPREAEPIRATINVAHPALAKERHASQVLREGLLAPKDADLIEVAVSSGERGSVVPSLDTPLRLVTIDRGASRQAIDEATCLLEMLVVGTVRQLVAELREAIHVGPLRAVPPRDALPGRRAGPSRWSDGIGAWDALLADRNDLLQRVNAELRRLGAGYKLTVQELFDPTAPAEALSALHTEATAQRLLVDMGTRLAVLPCEAGVGVSQLVPVVEAALEEPRRLVLLEQPESLLHPGLQVGLGDLFIEASRERQLLIETHSEHIMLRILRRIQETTEKELPEGAPAFTHDALRVLYVEAGEDGMRVHKLRVDPTGEFLDHWPGGFFEERVPEVL